MSDETNYKTQRIDHLGIVTGISREIGLVETIDQKVGESGRKVSCGEGMLAMIQNAQQIIRLLGDQVQKCYLFDP